MVTVKIKDYIIEVIVKNLLTSHKKLADSDNISGLISVTKILLKLANKCDDKVLNLTFIESESETTNPVKEG